MNLKSSLSIFMAILYSHALADPSSIFKPHPKEEIPGPSISFFEVTGLQGLSDSGFYCVPRYPFQDAQDVFRFTTSVNYFEFKKFMRSNGFTIGQPESLQDAPQTMFEGNGLRPLPPWIWRRPTKGFYIKTVSKDKKYTLHIIYQPRVLMRKGWSRFPRMLYIQATSNKSGG